MAFIMTAQQPWVGMEMDNVNARQTCADPRPTFDQFAATAAWRSLPFEIQLTTLHLRRAESLGTALPAQTPVAPSRYFFHVRKADGVEVDEIGVEFATLEDAIADARIAAAEMLIDALLEHSEVDGREFQITNQDGRVMATVPFSRAIATLR